MLMDAGVSTESAFHRSCLRVGAFLLYRTHHALMHDLTRQWLRWYDAKNRWLPTDAERAERLAARLQAMGLDPDELD